jgi:branched-chain amino acid transport system ATP-binding protein
MILRAEHVKVRYRNGAIGVSDVSLTLDSGQIIVLAGPNGAGKTTSVRALSGFLKAEGARVVAGNVTLFGRDVTNLEPWRTAKLGLSLIPERRKIFPNMSVRENLSALGTRPGRARRKELLATVFGLFPTLADRQHELAGRLSGGQQQMLAIGRSLLSEARILILDEMTLGLHHSLHEPLFDAARQLAHTGTGVIIVDERTTSGLAMADYCYLLEAGRVISEGRPAEVAEDALRAANPKEDR